MYLRSRWVKSQPIGSKFPLWEAECFISLPVCWNSDWGKKYTSWHTTRLWLAASSWCRAICNLLQITGRKQHLPFWCALQQVTGESGCHEEDGVPETQLFRRMVRLDPGSAVISMQRPLWLPISEKAWPSKIRYSVGISAIGLGVVEILSQIAAQLVGFYFLFRGGFVVVVLFCVLCCCGLLFFFFLSPVDKMSFSYFCTYNQMAWEQDFQKTK